MNKFFRHLQTIHTHRKYVRKYCFKMGIPWQGIVHDLSKYSPAELSIYKYWTGKKSPHQVCREQIGYSPSWIHHYHRNKHHHQFWIDETELGQQIAIKMPYKYVIEMFCDMVGASQAYNKENWTTDMPWQYYETKCKDKRIQHTDSEELLAELLWSLKELTANNYDFFVWYNSVKDKLQDAYENDMPFDARVGYWKD